MAGVEINNLGGIDTLETSLPPGINILSGENASNRTSFLRSIAAALGADNAAATLKSDAKEAYVSLTVDGETGTREYVDSNGSVIRTGDPFSEEPKLVDTYVALFGTNPARRAIRDGGKNLRNILMRGIDTAAVKARIQSLKQEQNSLESQLDHIESAQTELPNLRERENSLVAEVQELEEEISQVEQEIEEYEATSEEIEQAENHLQQLEERREKVSRYKNEMAETEKTIERFEEEKEEIKADLESLSVSEARLSELQDRRETIKSRVREVQDTISELDAIIDNNRSILDGDNILDEFDRNEDVTAQLDPTSATVQCWTCGSTVERSKIESRIDALAGLKSEKMEELQELNDEMDEASDEMEKIEKQANKRKRLEEELEDTKRGIQSEKEALEDLEQKVEDLREEIGDIEKRVNETEELRNSDLPEAYQRLSSLKHKLGRKQSQLESVLSEIDDKESQISNKDAIEQQIEEVKSDIETERGRIEETEREVINKFNGQMEDLIDLLDYDNISRVWVERLATNRNEVSDFEIHLVRETEEETVYEDTLDNLSESEREIIGIVVALSGYLVHDLTESVPFVLLDSVEAIDATRLDRLLEYISGYSPFIVVALLPEEAREIDRHTIKAPTFNAPQVP